MLEIHKPQSSAVRASIERLRHRMNVGRMIVRYRARRHWSQEELARRAGTKQSRVSELETLSGNVRFDTLEKIANALGLEITLQEPVQPITSFQTMNTPVNRSVALRSAPGPDLCLTASMTTGKYQ